MSLAKNKVIQLNRGQNLRTNEQSGTTEDCSAFFLLRKSENRGNTVVCQGPDTSCSVSDTCHYPDSRLRLQISPKLRLSYFDFYFIKIFVLYLFFLVKPKSCTGYSSVIDTVYSHLSDKTFCSLDISPC